MGKIYDCFVITHKSSVVIFAGVVTETIPLAVPCQFFILRRNHPIALPVYETVLFCLWVPGGGKFALWGHMEDHLLHALVEAEDYRHHYFAGIVDHSDAVALPYYGPGALVLIRPIVKTRVGPVAPVIEIEDVVI